MNTNTTIVNNLLRIHISYYCVMKTYTSSSSMTTNSDNVYDYMNYIYLVN